MPVNVNNANEIVMQYIQDEPYRYLRVDSFSGECDLSIIDASTNPERITLQVIAAEDLDSGLLELAQIIYARNTLDEAKGKK